MTLRHHKRAIGAFPNRRDAESALRDLRNSHYPMDKISVITKDSHRTDQGTGTNGHKKVGNKADEGATTGAVTGGALGGLTGLLVGLGTLAIPGVGPILLAGATATAIATTLAGGAIGAAAGGLAGALIGLGIPEHRAKVYNERVSRGEYLIIVEGTEAEIRRAESILHHRGIQEWEIFDAPKVAPSGTHPVTSKTSDHHHLDRDHHHSRAIGVFPHYHHTDAAIRELSEAGFPLNQISVISRDQDRHNWIPNVNVRDRFDKTSFGFLNDRHHFFHEQFNRGEYLIILEGTKAEIRRAEAILNRHGVREWEIFDAADHNSSDMGQSLVCTPNSDTTRHNHAIGVFSNRHNLEAAIWELSNAGFPINHVSLITRDNKHHNWIPGLNVRDHFDQTSFGFLKDRHHSFHNRFNQGEYLLILEEKEAQIRRVEPILRRHGVQEWAIFDGLNDDHSRRSNSMANTSHAVNHPHRAVGTFSRRHDMDTAIQELYDADFPMNQVSVIARDYQRHNWMPNLTIRDRFDSAFGFLGERHSFFHDRFNRGAFLVTVEGSQAQIHQAETILRRHGMQDWGIFNSATGQVKEPHRTNRISDDPEVVIVDRRHQTF